MTLIVILKEKEDKKKHKKARLERRNSQRKGRESRMKKHASKHRMNSEATEMTEEEKAKAARSKGRRASIERLHHLMNVRRSSNASLGAALDDASGPRMSTQSDPGQQMGQRRSGVSRKQGGRALQTMALANPTARNTHVLDHVEEQLRLDRHSHREGGGHHGDVVGLDQDNLDQLMDFDRIEQAKRAAAATKKKGKGHHHHSSHHHGHVSRQKTHLTGEEHDKQRELIHQQREAAKKKHSHHKHTHHKHKMHLDTLAEDLEGTQGTQVRTSLRNSARRLLHALKAKDSQFHHAAKHMKHASRSFVSHGGKHGHHKNRHVRSTKQKGKHRTMHKSDGEAGEEGGSHHKHSHHKHGEHGSHHKHGEHGSSEHHGHHSHGHSHHHKMEKKKTMAGIGE